MGSEAFTGSLYHGDREFFLLLTSIHERFFLILYRYYLMFVQLTISFTIYRAFRTGTKDYIPNTVTSQLWE